MLFLVVLFVIVLYLHMSKLPNERAAMKKYTRMVSIAFFALSALRHEAVGNDTYAYVMQFESFSDSWSNIIRNFALYYFDPSDSGKDPGYSLFLFLCSLITNDGRVFLFIVSAITISSIGWFIYRNSTNLRAICFSFVIYAVLFFQYIPNSAIRQSLALVILLFAYELLKNKKILFSALLIIVASTLHKSSLVGFLFLGMCYFNNVKLISRLSILAFCLVLLFPSDIATILADSSDVYTGYGSGTYYVSSRPYMIILLMIGLFVVSLLILGKDSIPEDNKMFYYGACLSFVLTPLVWSNPTILRLLSYFGLYMSLLIGNKINEIPNSKTIFTVLLLVFFAKAAITKSNYHFMWEEMQYHERYSYVEPLDTPNQSH